ncbi:MAG TPA: IS200/IS605 family transposase [Bacteroidia bacterium]|nr:IS200/IS605 family transposase [Bacteroidia bacterium]
MAGTYSQLYVQIIFAVSGRENLIAESWKHLLNKYIAGIIEAKGQKSIIVNGTADHIHCFVGLKPSMAVSNLTRDIKNNSSKFINENNFLSGKFKWQEGYGAFSYSQSSIPNVYSYILNQEEYHKRNSFKNEYLELLNKFQIDFEPHYLFNWIE